MKRCCFCKEQIRSVKRKVSIYFISRYLMISLYTIYAARIKKHARSDNISLKENTRVCYRTVNMALCCKINNNIRLLILKKLIYKFSVCYITFNKFESLFVHYRLKRLKITGISKLVQTYNLIVRIFVNHIMNKITSDKSGSSGYNYFHASIPPFSISLLTDYYSILTTDRGGSHLQSNIQNSYMTHHFLHLKALALPHLYQKVSDYLFPSQFRYQGHSRLYSCQL